MKRKQLYILGFITLFFGIVLLSLPDIISHAQGSHSHAPETSEVHDHEKKSISKLIPFGIIITAIGLTMVLKNDKLRNSL